jgi:hypothetical protein
VGVSRVDQSPAAGAVGGTGRRGNMGLKLPEQVKGYVSEDEARRIKEHAAEIGMSVSTYVRVAVLQYLRNYERNAAPAVVSTEEMIERL